ncbi:uncharacterized protein TEOVI_000872300 [Trypanosoma equiperdum]|uniref:Uncharacterized protein n=1 Tax=Trypanosoma equiperdum TaxID=5694 RepID=A0A1G4I9G5_TRYEQ|nr:hypothetical protein, conserved [Trypanosoma equiperdum]
MALRDIVGKQMLRQTVLQPRLKLPAGRVVSIEEGWRLARLVREGEEHASALAVEAAEGMVAPSSVVLEDDVSKRILLLRHKKRKEGDTKAAVRYAQRSRAVPVVGKVAPEVRDIALNVLRKNPIGRAELRARHERSKAKRATKGSDSTRAKRAGRL